MSIIDKPSDYFNTKLYTGNASTQSIDGVGFSPDLTWIKSRGTTAYHNLYDSVRGATKIIQSNTTTAEQTFSDGLTSFDSDGFSVGSRDDVNGSSYSLVSWNWKAGGTASSNTNGSITSSVSANQDAGFSIVSYTGTGSAETIGHGLGAVPKMIIVKTRGTSGDWSVYHSSLPVTHVLILNTTEAAYNPSIDDFQDTAPTSDVFYITATAGRTNANGTTFVAYCFAEKQGYSKFGSYTGNGSTDGTFVYTGFKPAFVMCRQSDLDNDWWIFDNRRSAFNLAEKRLRANTNASEYTDATKGIDLLSNGFKLRTSNGEFNGSGGTYIYMAFASEPFTTSAGVPATAR